MAFWNKKKKKEEEVIDEAEAILREFDDDEEIQAPQAAAAYASAPAHAGGGAPPAAIDYGKLGWLSPASLQHMAPAQLEELFQGVCGPSSEPGWLSNIQNSRLSCVAVVQANKILYNPAEATWAPAVLLAFDAPEAANPDWMQAQLGRLHQALEGGALPELSNLLANQDSHFNIELPREFTGGALARVFVLHINPEMLPSGCIPQDRIMPALQFGAHWVQIPTEWYE